MRCRDPRRWRSTLENIVSRLCPDDQMIVIQARRIDSLMKMVSEGKRVRFSKKDWRPLSYSLWVDKTDSTCCRVTIIRDKVVFEGKRPTANSEQEFVYKRIKGALTVCIPKNGRVYTVDTVIIRVGEHYKHSFMSEVANHTYVAGMVEGGTLAPAPEVLTSESDLKVEALQPCFVGDLMQCVLHYNMPLRDILVVLQRVAFLLGRLHDQRYVHLDITPYNVFMDKGMNPCLGDCEKLVLMSSTLKGVYPMNPYYIFWDVIMNYSGCATSLADHNGWAVTVLYLLFHDHVTHLCDGSEGYSNNIFRNSKLKKFVQSVSRDMVRDLFALAGDKLGEELKSSLQEQEFDVQVRLIVDCLLKQAISEKDKRSVLEVEAKFQVMRIAIEEIVTNYKYGRSFIMRASRSLPPDLQNGNRIRALGQSLDGPIALLCHKINA